MEVSGGQGDKTRHPLGAERMDHTNKYMVLYTKAELLDSLELLLPCRLLHHLTGCLVEVWDFSVSISYPVPYLLLKCLFV